MNVIEHLLTCLAEEAVEMAQDTCKALRFGLGDVNYLKPDGPDNRERLIVEMNQFEAVKKMLIEAGHLPADWERLDVQQAKREAVETNMAYAEAKGVLQTGPPAEWNQYLGRTVQVKHDGCITIGVCESMANGKIKLRDACDGHSLVAIGDGNVEIPLRGAEMRIP